MSQAAYDTIGHGYALRRHPDPRISASVTSALGAARTVINVGAGAGSYEPTDRVVLAIEPSKLMISQRPVGAARCVCGTAEALPVGDATFDAGMAILTIHHWSDWKLGLREMWRVVRDRIVLLTFDVGASNFWLNDYFPELKPNSKSMPSLEALAEALGPFASTIIPIPHDCTDGFLGAYWRRPEVYLDPAARGAMSPFANINAQEGLRRLANDLKNGAWQKRYAEVLAADTLDLGYRLLRWEKPEN